MADLHDVQLGLAELALQLAEALLKRLHLGLRTRFAPAHIIVLTLTKGRFESGRGGRGAIDASGRAAVTFLRRLYVCCQRLRCSEVG